MNWPRFRAESRESPVGDIFPEGRAPDSIRLGIHFTDLRTRVAILLPLLQELQLRFQRCQAVACFANLCRRSRAGFRQLLESFIVLLSGVAIGLRLHQVRPGIQHFFLRASRLV